MPDRKASLYRHSRRRVHAIDFHRFGEVPTVFHIRPVKFLRLGSRQLNWYALFFPHLAPSGSTNE